MNKWRWRNIFWNAFRNAFHCNILLPPASEGWREVIFSLCVSVHTLWGGSQVQVQVGGVQVQVQVGGSQVQVQVGGYPVSDLGGYPVSDLGGTQSQVRAGYLVPVEGKNFDTRFGLIHVQTGKKKFLSRGDPPPPPSKGKNFWHQIWLDTCSDWEKKFLSRDPHPPTPGIARTCYGLQTLSELLTKRERL